MKYVAEFSCIGCKERLTWEQVSQSHGVCPKCGRVSVGEVMDVKKTAVPVEDAPATKWFSRQ